MTKLEVILSSIDNDFRFIDRPDLAQFINWRNGNNTPIHRWFRYREGYSPKLVNALSVKDPILDPFCGSGSTLLGAAINNMHGTGVDINPLATFIAKVKLTPLLDKEISRIIWFYENINDLIYKYDPWPMPNLKIANKVFEPQIIITLLRIRSALENLGTDNVRNFVLLAWLSILEQVGSYFKEGNGIKYRNKKRLKSGYIFRPEGLWQLDRFGSDQEVFVMRAFLKQLEIMLSDVNYWDLGSWREQKVLTNDSTDLKNILPGEKYQSIIFSPPYMNRFDYFESQKVELWFGNFVNSYNDLALIRKKSLRSHLGASLNKDINKSVAVLEDLINQMDQNASSWRMNIQLAMRGYFDDMYYVLKQCRDIVTEHGQCHIIVGNSAFAGIIIPTDAILAHLAKDLGFSIIKLYVVRHLTVAPQQRITLNGLQKYMRESILVLGL